MSYAIAKRASRHGEIEVKLPITRVIGIERHPQEALFARSARQHPLNVEKGLGAQLTGPKIQRENLSGLLHDKKMINITRRRRDKERLG